MVPAPDIDTVVVLSTPVVLIVTTSAEEDCMLYNEACKFLLTTDFNCSLVFCPFSAFA